MAYIGIQPTDTLSTTPIVNTFTGDGTSNVFTLSREVVNGQSSSLEVFVSNVQQQPAASYSVYGANLNFIVAPGLNEPIYVIFRDYSISPYVTLPPGTVTTTVIEDGAITTSKLANAAVTSEKIASTGVISATYGNATLIPVITVSSDGRITSASNVSVSTNISTITGNVSITGNVRAQTYQETFANVAIASGNISLNLSNATVFRTVVTGAANVILQNPPPANVGYSFVLQLYQTGSYAIVWPSSIQWPLNTAPTLSTTNGYVDTIAMYTLDGGSNYYATSILSQY